MAAGSTCTCRSARTTDTDTRVRPGQGGARRNRPDLHPIPDGFYLVGDADRPEPEFQRALIGAVRPVTHIAQPDAEGRIIGVTMQQEGVIHLAKRSSGLCGGMTDARFVTTTEVVPRQPDSDPQRSAMTHRWRVFGRRSNTCCAL
jgi:hypothetical protein